MAGLSFAERTSGSSLFSQVIRFSIPLVLTSLLSQLFTTADTLVVGRWGGDTAAQSEACLAAVGSCSSLINLIVCVSVGLSIGGGVLVARHYGAGDHRALSDTLHTAISAGILVGFFVGLVGFFGAPLFLRWMGTNPGAMFHATRYMRAYFVGVPAMIVYNYAASALRATGDTVRPLFFLLASGVVNVGLNLIAVLVFRWGAMGVGVATAASNLLSCVLVLIYLFRKQGLCHLQFSRLRIRRSILVHLLYIGIPVSMQSALFSISNVLIQTAVNGLGETAIIAANTAASNIEGYIYLAQNAFAQAAMTFVSQSVGAALPRRANQSMLVCLLCGSAVGLSLGVSCVLGGRTLLSWFMPGASVGIDIGMRRLMIVALPYFLCAVMETGCSALRGLGHSLLPMLISLIGACGLRIVWIYTVFAANPIPEILYLCFPVTWSVTAITQFVAYTFCYRRYKHRMAAL